MGMKNYAVHSLMGRKSSWFPPIASFSFGHDHVAFETSMQVARQAKQANIFCYEASAYIKNTKVTVCLCQRVKNYGCVCA
jgi:hypothetical protein